MAEPKKKLSKTRTNRRRANYKTALSPSTTCANCGTVLPTHQVCSQCGFYRGSAVIPQKPKERIVTDEKK